METSQFPKPSSNIQGKTYSLRMDEAKAKGVDSLRSPFLGSIPTKLMVRLAKIGLKEEIKNL